MSIRKFFVSIAALTALTAPVWAADGWEHNSEYNKLFNPKTVQTVTGKVVKVDRHFVPLKGMQAGFMAVVQPAQGPAVEVQIGPSWFTSFYKQDWNIKVDDQVAVTGSLVKIGDHNALMVVQGRDGEHKLTVRTKLGWPVWDFEVADF